MTRVQLSLRSVLIAVLAVAVVCGLVLRPLYKFARAQASVNNLKTLSLALHQYHDAYGCFPPALISDPMHGPMHSWRAFAIPYLDDGFLGVQDFKASYRTDEPWSGPNNQKLSKTHWFGDRTEFLAVVGEHSIWQTGKSMSIRDVRDGTANTILVVEFPASTVTWLEPRDLRFDGDRLYLREGEFERPVSIAGCRVLLADGSVWTLNPRITTEQVKSLITVDGGETRFDPWTLEQWNAEE